MGQRVAFKECHVFHFKSMSDTGELKRFVRLFEGCESEVEADVSDDEVRLHINGRLILSVTPNTWVVPEDDGWSMYVDDFFRREFSLKETE